MRKSRHIHNLTSQFLKGVPSLRGLETEDAAEILESAGFIALDRSAEPWRYTETEKMRAIPPYDFPDAVRKYLISKLKEALREESN